MSCILISTQKGKSNALYFEIASVIAIVSIGILSISLHTQRNKTEHYVHFISNKSAQNIHVQIIKKLKPNSYYSKYLGKVTAVNKQLATGIILINVDSTIQLKIDDVHYVTSNIKSIQHPLNPHQFDFKDYMQKQQVYNQIYLNKNNSFILYTNKTPLGYADDIRKRINQNLNKYPFTKVNLSIINALLLGQRQDISKDTYKSFTQSGTIHILAISGLHIGLLMLLLGWLLKPLNKFKNGQKVIPIIIILLLWCYAFLTGLSSSVLRAVTMFSLLSIAIHSKRITNTYNTLFISAFVLLLYNPYYLFEIGFQLSYCAVFAIISLKPLCDKIWTPTHFISKKLWDVFTVSITAQFGILPLSLFYFHQFPALFLVSNLIIIPCLGILLGIGILTIVLAYFNLAPYFLLQILDYGITLLNQFVYFISKQESLLFKDISFNNINLITISIFIICISLVWHQKSVKRFTFVLLSCIGIQLGLIYNKIQSQTEEFIVFNQYKNTLIAHKKGKSLQYQTADNQHLDVIKRYATSEFINTTTKIKNQNSFIINNQKILLVDSLGIYKTTLKPDIVVLSQSPKINLNRLLQELKPKIIVADNNNYRSYIKTWEQTCRAEKINFHYTRLQGAYILSTKNPSIK